MRSLYVRILAASFGTLLLSLAAFLAVFFFVTGPSMDRAFRTFQTLETESAVDALDRGGATGLSEHFARVDDASAFTHYLADASGRDVITGIDRSALLASERGDRPRRVGGQVVTVKASRDGRYRMITMAPPPFGLGDLLPYFALILITVALLCWLLAWDIASPLRKMGATVNRLGGGKLDVRADVHRRDEIGDLARSFNQMAERIETLVAAERRLLQDVSHELRSPLTRLNLGIELSRTAVDREAAADRLQRDTNRLTDLVATLLEVSRLEAEPTARASVPVDISSVLRDVVSDCQMEAEARQTTIGLDGAATHTIAGDPELLRRVFENLVRNAIRYAPPETVIDVRYEERPSETVISVRDFGPGVPEDAVSSLGMPFYRVDPSRDPATGGVGLGLAIARRAIHMHQGTWKAENAGPGLRVVITLPATG